MKKQQKLSIAKIKQKLLKFLMHSDKDYFHFNNDMVYKDRRFGNSHYYLFEAFKKWSQIEVESHQVMEALWQLASEGLVYIDYSQPSPGNWQWLLSERGQKVAESDDDYEPDDPERYLENIRNKNSDIDDLVYLYTKEALKAYNASCYLASSVMIGVASERAFQLLGEAFSTWLPEKEATLFREKFNSPNQLYLTKFNEFRKRIEHRKNDLTSEFSDNMSLTFDSVADLLRINRNASGHPTGRTIDRDEAYINLQMFARYLHKLYGLKNFLKNPKKGIT